MWTCLEQHIVGYHNAIGFSVQHHIYMHKLIKIKLAKKKPVRKHALTVLVATSSICDVQPPYIFYMITYTSVCMVCTGVKWILQVDFMYRSIKYIEKQITIFLYCDSNIFMTYTSI